MSCVVFKHVLSEKCDVSFCLVRSFKKNYDIDETLPRVFYIPLKKRQKNNSQESASKVTSDWFFDPNITVVFANLAPHS